MNYALHYDRLIERARGRVLDGYRERHHVLPRCMGGTNARANLVWLTAEEHFCAHALLVRMHPDNHKLAHAANLMASKRTGRIYGWLRRRHAQAISKVMAGNQYRVGYKHSEEHKEYLRQLNLGKKMSQDAIERSSNSRRGVKRSEESCARISASKLGTKQPPDAVERRALRLRGIPLSTEHRKKIAKSNTGKKHSPESRAKMSAWRTGRKFGKRSPKIEANVSS